jgi:hypothetical protein
LILPQTDGKIKRDECHIDCLSERLGRELTISDFDPEAPINRMLFFGYRMGRRPNETGNIPDLPPIIGALRL